MRKKRRGRRGFTVLSLKVNLKYSTLNIFFFFIRNGELLMILIELHKKKLKKKKKKKLKRVHITIRKKNELHHSLLQVL